MKLNSLAPAKGSHRNSKRVGRGMGSGFGKTCGRGHKGFKARSGSGIKPGFEGGQQPLQRRLPKYGFVSRKSSFTDEIRLSELKQFGEGSDVNVIDISVLKASGLVGVRISGVKVICSGKLDKALTLKGLKVTKGARKIIEMAGGKIED